MYTGMAEPLRMVTCTQFSLIDPLEVHVEVPPVHVAEPVLTPIGIPTIFLNDISNLFKINLSLGYLARITTKFYRMSEA